MLHAHILSWFVALILFIVAVILAKKKKERGTKIVSMILRLFYLFIIITGALILFSININGTYIVKAILGIVVIGFFEMVLSKTAKKEAAGIYWALLVVSFLIVLYLGYMLPLSAH